MQISRIDPVATASLRATLLITKSIKRKWWPTSDPNDFGYGSSFRSNFSIHPHYFLMGNYIAFLYE